MKTLYIVRHAKAEEITGGMKDFDRSLTREGKSDASLVGKELNKLDIKPAMILTSPAKRALETAQLVVDELDLSVANIVTNKEIYEASLKTIMEVIYQTPDKASSLLIFGHNPSLHELVNYLGNKTFEKFQKGAAVAITFENNKWKEIRKQSGKITYFDFPKNIRQYSVLKSYL